MAYDGYEGAESAQSLDGKLLEEQARRYAAQQRGRKMMDNEPADNGIVETATCTDNMDLMGREILDVPLYY